MPKQLSSLAPSSKYAATHTKGKSGTVISCVDDDSSINKEVEFTYKGTSSNLADTTDLTLIVPENPCINDTEGDFIFNDLRGKEVIGSCILVEDYLLPTALEYGTTTTDGKTLTAKVPLRNVFKGYHPVSLDNTYLRELSHEDSRVLQRIVDGVRSKGNTLVFTAMAYDEDAGQAIWEAKSMPVNWSQLPEPTVEYNSEEISKDAAIELMRGHNGKIEYQRAS